MFDQIAVESLREAAAHRLKIVLKVNKAALKPSSAAKQQCVGGECGGPVAPRHEPFAQGGVVPSEKRTIALHTMRRGIQSCEQRSVYRQRPGGRRNRVFKKCAFGCELRQVRTGRSRVSVRRK